MPEPCRLLSTPIRITGQPDVGQLSSLVAADVLARRARAAGREVDWSIPTLVGDLAGQIAAEQDLAREGLDRATIAREDFIDRVKALEAVARAELAAILDDLGVDADLERAATDSELVGLAARTAFARLYEEGRLQAAERVVDTCPRCATVVERADIEAEDIAAEVVSVCAPFSDDEGGLVVDVVALELLPGAVAIAVPEDHAGVGRLVALPLAGQAVPLIGVADCLAPAIVVPAHDSDAFVLAEAHGLLAIIVLDEDGVVIAEGPLRGLARYAARAAAYDALRAGGVVDATAPGVEAVHRCRRCATVLVARLGRHWFLSAADLEIAAADAVREGAVAFVPAAALDGFLERAGTADEWCLTHQVEAGVPVPVFACLDCGKVTVSVDTPDSCNRCMGTLVPDGAVFDSRFVGALWPLVAAGWPAAEVIEPPADSTLIVGPSGVVKWALPTASLGLRLAGAIPFAKVAVNDLALGDETVEGLRSIAETQGRDAARAALTLGSSILGD